MFEQLALFTTHFQGDDFGLVFWMLAKVPDSKVLSSHLTLEDIDKKWRKATHTAAVHVWKWG